MCQEKTLDGRTGFQSPEENNSSHDYQVTLNTGQCGHKALVLMVLLLIPGIEAPTPKPRPVPGVCPPWVIIPRQKTAVSTSRCAPPFPPILLPGTARTGLDLIRPVEARTW